MGTEALSSLTRPLHPGLVVRGHPRITNGLLAVRLRRRANWNREDADHERGGWRAREVLKASEAEPRVSRALTVHDNLEPTRSI